VQSGPAIPDASAATQREVVAAFLAASRQGDFAGLLRLLDPHVVLRADPIVVGFGAAAEVRGPDGVAQTFAGRAQAARLTLVDGLAGAVWSVGGRSRVVFRFTVRGGRVVSIELLGDPETLDVLDLEPVRERASAAARGRQSLANRPPVRWPVTGYKDVVNLDLQFGPHGEATTTCSTSPAPASPSWHRWSGRPGEAD